MPGIDYPFPGYVEVGDAARLFGRDCVLCDEEPQCPTCPPPGQCVQIARSCSQCAVTRCVGASKGGVNPGIIAGPIIGVVLIGASLFIFWWLRKKKQRDLARVEELADRARKGESSAFHLSQPTSPSATKSRHVSQQIPASPQSPGSGGSGGMRQVSLQQQQQQGRQALPNVPADAEFYDENGATIRVYSGKRGVINADPNHPDNGGNGDPFADQRSMSTAGSGHSTNVIPIHFVPDEGAAAGDVPTTADQQAQAARTLDLARQNLFRPGGLPPRRPARAPDLDLRLNPPGRGEMHLAGQADPRMSIGSMTSGAPSFLSSNTADLHLDVPKIVTRQQVHVGRLQAAEVVQFSTLRAAAEGGSNDAANPFNEKAEHAGSDHSQQTFGNKSSTVHSGGDASASRVSVGSRRFDDDGNAISQPSPTDLRFSMGSLAYDRNSVSTTGTGAIPPPPYTQADRPRFESISSSHSLGGDSLLGSFPMIAPSAGAGHPLGSVGRGGVPQNSSTTSLELSNAAHVTARPPVAYKNGSANSNAQARPLTAASSHSIADSFLGRFPFVPPNVNGDGSPVPGIPAGGTARGSQANPGRLTLGMSSVSEGLGDFDFSFEGGAPGAGGAGVEEHVEGPATPRAPTMQR